MTEVMIVRMHEFVTGYEQTGCLQINRTLAPSQGRHGRISEGLDDREESRENSYSRGNNSGDELFH
jgi:hypothetical protein